LVGVVGHAEVGFGFVLELIGGIVLVILTGITGAVDWNHDLGVGGNSGSVRGEVIDGGDASGGLWDA
jgi:hypothetical protein